MIDTFLFKAFHGIALHYPLVQGLVIIFARFAIFAYPLLFLRFARWKRCIKLSLPSLALAYGINALISLVWYRDRPFVSLDAQPLFDTHYLHDSFPSDHAALAMALAASIFLCAPRTRGVYAIVIAVLIGVARIMAGVHYPSDILAGFGVGLFAAAIGKYIDHRVSNKPVL
ncbi:phosphatase PAP2 family protein [Candidatus Uhrbacteria bacterium]|nr:phosphatase PAP2 family protein [Candidatus Uhrbacteria bacterium]